MNNTLFERKQRENKPVLAICYDFDKTLSPDDMQAQGYIQSVGYDVNKFWSESNSMARENDMDQNLAYMYKMMQEADGKIVFNKEKLQEYGSKVALFPGVDGWFERIKKYGEKKGVIVEHYIISSGLKEMIEGTSVAKSGAFEKIYASSFYYESGRSAKWPAQVVNFTNKTQFLFRIEKGVLDINDSSVNDYFPPEKIRVPFRNMVYIGDSDTDIPCMKLVNSHGGHSIGVYSTFTKEKNKVFKMMRENRIRYFTEADYSEGKELDKLVKMIIDKTVAAEKLEEYHEFNEKERCDSEKDNSKEKQQKYDLLFALKESDSFESSKKVLYELISINDWTEDQAKRIIEITNNNKQALSFLSDKSNKKIRSFYKALINKFKIKNEASKKIKSTIKKFSIKKMF